MSCGADDDLAPEPPGRCRVGLRDIGPCLDTPWGARAGAAGAVNPIDRGRYVGDNCFLRCLGLDHTVEKRDGLGDMKPGFLI